MILHTDYMARVERVIKEAIHPGTRVLAVVEFPSMNIERPAYWERFYFVAWANEKEAGTHRVSINSEERGAAFYGHYQLTEVDAVHDAIERAGLTAGRI
jgi:hypothetical protein